MVEYIFRSVLIIWGLSLSDVHITPCSHNMVVKDGIQVEVQEGGKLAQVHLKLHLLD